MARAPTSRSSCTVRPRISRRLTRHHGFHSRARSCPTLSSNDSPRMAWCLKISPRFSSVLWDAGLVLGNGRQLLQVYTTNSRSMAEIAVPLEAFERAGCKPLSCSSQLRSQFCKGSQILSVSMCVTDDLTDTATNTAMWATGTGRVPNSTDRSRSVVPEMRLLRHEWVDGPNATPYLVYAIHTVLEQYQPAWGKCPVAGLSQRTGLTVPCGAYTAERDRTKWQRPPPTAFVTKWLKVHKHHVSRRHTLDAVYVAVSIGAALIVVGAIVWWFRRRRHATLQSLQDASVAMLAHDGLDVPKLLERSNEGDPPNNTSGTPTRSPHHRLRSSRFRNDVPHSALRVLLEEDHLIGKRLDIEKIVLQRQVSKGAFGEVWLASHRGRQVAVKRMRQDKKLTFQDLEKFTAEIRLTASLSHLHLVRFVGVAWRSLDFVCMVTEYMVNGDLQAYLETHKDTLSGFWTSEKTAIALGVAKALVYLHDRSPPLIHRDIKAKNVLLDEELSPRLMDFGVSRLCELDRTMTTGIGTPFWTAPEIMEGLRYIESSDMYSFGVLLTELETCKLPYHDHQSRHDLQYDLSITPGFQPNSSHADATAGSSSSQTTSSTSGPKGVASAETPLPATLRPFLILNLVMSGSLRPSLSPESPEWLRDLVTACFRSDPALRPTAQQIVEVLSRQWSMLE